MQPVSTIGNTLFSNGTVGSGAVTSQQRTFSAPSSLKCTPVTGAAAPVVSRVSVAGSEGSRRAVTINTSAKKPHEESESEVERTPIEKDVEESEQKPAAATASVTAPIPLIRRHSTPQQPAAGSPSSRSPHFQSSPPKFFNTAPAARSPTTQKYISRRLSLSNYVAPSVSAPADEKKDDEDKKSGDEALLVTPPTTPPRETKLKDLPESAKETRENIPEMLSPLIMIGGMPASDVSGPMPRVSSPVPRFTAPPTIKTTNLPVNNAQADDASPSVLPFSPTSRARFGMSPLGAQFGSLSQLASPPVSRQGSENSTPSSSGRNSPNRKPSPPPTFLRRKESPVRLELPDAQSSFADEVRKLSPSAGSPEESESQVTTPTPMSPGPVQVPGQGNKVDTSDSSYAAFVRQWCFAQSTPPTPGVLNVSPNNSTPPTPPPPTTTMSSSPQMSSSFNGANGFGLASALGVGPKRQQAWPADHFSGPSGYGFPGFGFGGAGVAQKSQGAAIVGGELHSPFDGALDAAAVSGYARGIIV